MLTLAKSLLLLASVAAVANSASIPTRPLSPRSSELKKALRKRQDSTTAASSDATVLNFALTLELVDISLFNGALSNFSDSDFTSAGFPSGARGTVQRIAEDEQAHADIIRAALLEIGATPVEACQYKFPYTDVKSFMALSAIIEGVGTSAYIGSLGAFTSSAHTTAGAGILAVETRHNALLRYLNEESPDPAATDAPLSAQAVTGLAAGFFVPNSCPQGSALQLTPFPALNITSNTTNPILGETIDLVPATPFSAEVAAAPIYCGFTSGIDAVFSAYTNGACQIPTQNLTLGQTYLALTSVQSLSDASILAGLAVLNLVNTSQTFLDLQPVFSSSSSSSAKATGGTKPGAASLTMNPSFLSAGLVGALAVGSLLI